MNNKEYYYKKVIPDKHLNDFYKRFGYKINKYS